MSCLRYLLVPIAIISCSLRPAVAGDWPGFRGPTGMGSTTERGLPLEWGGADAKNILWKSPLPATANDGDPDHNQSSPIVAANKVFITTAYWPKGIDKTKQQPQHHVTCFDANSGKQLWDTVVEPGPWLLSDLRGGYAAPTPAVAGGRVFAVFGSSVSTLSTSMASLFAAYTIGEHEQFDVALPVSPVVYRDTIILQLDKKRPASKLVALDAATGKVRWERARPDCDFNHMTPVLAEVGGRVKLLVSATDELQGIDPEDGAVIWPCRWGQSIWPVSSPVVAGGLVYAIGGRGGHPASWSIRRDAVTCRPPTSSGASGQARKGSRPGRVRRIRLPPQLARSAALHPHRRGG